MARLIVSRCKTLLCTSLDSTRYVWFIPTNNSSISRQFTTSRQRNGLMEFFDHKDNWGEEVVRVGRPWRKDELRLKSNTDLHKLWYVLLKERNMLMTMEAEYNRTQELFPSPERFDKVEESMENLLDVVNERDRAFNLLETGETGEPGVRWLRNQLGIGNYRKMKEFHMPMHVSDGPLSKSDVPRPLSWQLKYKKLYREKILQTRSKGRSIAAHRKEELQQKFTGAEVD